jgi:hypothetical protein
VGNQRPQTQTVQWNQGAYTWTGTVTPPQSLATTVH